MRKRWIIAVGLSGILGFGLMQFVPAPRTNPPIRSTVQASAEVVEILERACFDCHSNETRWPWYSKLAPPSLLLVRHVRKGREEVNFSEWPRFDFELQEILSGQVAEQVESLQMPPRGYLALHRTARLSPADRTVLVEWFKADPSADFGLGGP